MRPITQSRMRRRRWLPAAFCLLCCLLFSGCTPGATVDSLLKPPSLSEEQQQIYLAYCQYMARKAGDNVNHNAHFYGALYGLIYPAILEPSLIKRFYLSLFS